MNGIEIPPKIPYKDKQVNIGGIKLNYWEEGSGPETLMFIHGFTGNIEEWYFQVSHFEKIFKVIAIDLRGHGKSEIKDEDFTIEQISDDIYQFLEKKGIPEIVLIGHSMGGMIAQLFTLKYPKKVKKLVLISTVPGGSSRKIPEAYLEFVKSKSVPELIDMMSKAASIPLEKHKPERRTFYKRLQEWSIQRRGKGISKDGYIRYLKATSNFDIRGRLGEIKVPTLIFCGDKDKLTGKLRSKLLNEKIPNSKIIIFPECGHSPQREYFNEFNEHLQKFLLE